MIRHVCLCERGCQRPLNQDRAGGWTAGDQGLFFVADGIGGHYSGETASQAIADALAEWWNSGPSMPLPAVQQQLQLLVQNCHTRILQGTPPGQQCGSTLVLLWLSGRTYTLLWTGDSRCYQTRRQHLRGHRSHAHYARQRARCRGRRTEPSARPRPLLPSHPRAGNRRIRPRARTSRACKRGPAPRSYLA